MVVYNKRWLEDSISRCSSRRYVLAGLVLLSTVGTFGCVSHSPLAAPEAEVKYVGFTQAKQVPFSLKVTDDAKQGDSVHLLAELTGLRSWTPSEVGVRVSTFLEGAEVSSHLFSGSQLFSLADTETLFAADQSQEFVLSFRSAPFSHYELQVLWGEDLRRAVANKAAEAGLVRFVSDSTKLVAEKDCVGAAECDTRFVAEGSILNGHTEVVEEVVLGVRYVPDSPNSAQSGVSLGEEQSVTLSSLAIAPGAQRRIKMNIGKGLPQKLAATLRPQVRVIRFTSAAQRSSDVVEP